MAANSTIAQAFKDTYTSAELSEIQSAALLSYTNGVNSSISFEGGSVQINSDTAISLLENIQEALRMCAAEAESLDPVLATSGVGIQFDFRNKRLT